MTLVLFERRLITEHVRGVLEDALKPHPVGVADLPDKAGWLGQPRGDGSNFRPYAVITPMTSSESTGTLGFSQSEWRLPFAVTSYGVSATQAEWMADEARIAMSSLQETDLETSSKPSAALEQMHVQQVMLNSIGTLTKASDAIQPSFWSQSDVLTLWLTQI
jgi:hypothetical protein